MCSRYDRSRYEIIRPGFQPGLDLGDGDIEGYYCDAIPSL
jgi:hypothetical protein